MEQEWEAAADEKGGKHRKQVEAMYNHIKDLKTPEERKNAMIDLGCLQLQAMKTDGSTLADVLEALEHVVKNGKTLLRAGEHGVK